MRPSFETQLFAALLVGDLLPAGKYGSPQLTSTATTVEVWNVDKSMYNSTAEMNSHTVNVSVDDGGQHHLGTFKH